MALSSQELEPSSNPGRFKKHGVGFDEAKSVFLDDHAKMIPDPAHSIDEERFVLLGYSSSLKLLVVCHCYRAEGRVIRIISARKATRLEAQVCER
ncbi:MAG: BrnT family toxin [Azoarcus sp.]|nr:BrnT family toxin [Azoarcus sp.]